MPALRLFGRRWLLASDDVPVPAAVCALFHFVWCILLVIWFASVHGPRECSGAWQYDVGVGGLLAAFVLSFVLEALLVRHGLRGGPFEARKRRLVPRLIYVDFASHICQVAFNAYCTHLIYNSERPQCQEGQLWDPFDAMQVLVWCTWALIASLLLLLVLSYNLFPNYSDPKSWEQRCDCLGTLLCCCGWRRDNFQHGEDGQPVRLTARLGNLFAMLFSHIDMTPSDILLAFSLAMMLQRIQRKRQLEQEQLRQQAEGPAAAAATGAAAGPLGGSAAANGGHRRSGAAALGWRPSGGGIQLTHSASPSPQSSPNRPNSVCSTDELLSNRSMPDLEQGLLATAARPTAGAARSRSGSLRGGGGRQAAPQAAAAGRAGTATTAAAAAAAAAAGTAIGDEADHIESFVPVRPVGDGLQVGAEKTEEGPGGEPAPGDSCAGEQGAVDADTVKEAAWAMKYAFASYGVLLFIFSKPTTGCLELCCGRQCGLVVGTARGRRQRRKLDLRLVHNLNREATQQAAGLSDRDLLDVRYEGEVPHVLPYFIAVDERHKTVVIAIRGSLSLDDVVRDLLFEPASLDEWVQPGSRRWEDEPPPLKPATSETRFAAHAGILEAARATFVDMQEHGVLHETLLAPHARCRGYQLVLTGHSLGAGCAFLLALYLRHFCPELKCWALSPPGGLASQELCAAAGDWCRSVVCGKEWIPRLSMRTFARMRDEMVYAALRCRRPKWEVLAGLMVGRRWREDELFYRPEELPAEAKEALHTYHDSVAQSEAVRHFMELAGDFTPPGRCFHLKPIGATVTGRLWWRVKQRRYRAVWIDGNAIIDEGILVSGRMMADHMPDYLLATLRSMERSLRHLRSTTTVSDKAGERLTDDVMSQGQPRQQDGSARSGSRNNSNGAAAVAAGSSAAGSEAQDLEEGGGGGGGGGSGGGSISSSRRGASGGSSRGPAATAAAPPQQPAPRRAPSVV